MTPAKKSQILRFARHHIEKQKCDMLCSAINKVRVGTIEHKTELLRWIRELLAGYTTFGSWMRHNHPGIYADMLKAPGSIRKARLQWIDWMITYYEQEESHDPA